MSGPYRDGLGKRKRSNPEFINCVDSSDSDTYSAKEDQEIFFSSSPGEGRTQLKKRRVRPTDAEVIPEFHPEKSSSNVKGWLHKIDQLGDVYGWNNTDRQFVMQLRLKGAAREWYDDLDEYNLTWDEWKHALFVAFPRSTDYVDRLEQMLARTKQDSETMTKYYHDKLSLLKKCGIDGERANSCIIRGLPADLRANAKAYRCDTPEQLYFGYLSSLENYRRLDTSFTSTRGTWRRSAPNTVTNQYQLQPRACYVCRQPGHEARDCRMQKRCETCRRVGHTTASCWFAPGASRPQDQKCSSRLLSACGATVLLELPATSAAQRHLAAGTSVFALVTGRIDFTRFS